MSENTTTNITPTTTTTVESSNKWNHLYTLSKEFNEPILLQAHIVHGFKRGSKELGIPTANLNMNELDNLGNNIETGIYYGYCYLRKNYNDELNNNNKYKAVVSVGWNPYYKNKLKTIEAHLLNEFNNDFYDDIIDLYLIGYLRPETDFSSLGNFILYFYYIYFIY